MVQPEQVEQCCMQVVDVHFVFHGVVAVVIGLAEPEASLSSAGLEEAGRNRAARTDSRIRIDCL